jgi:hypothetical protein
MAGNPFSDSEINDKIRVQILRLQAESLEWAGKGSGSSFDEHIVDTLTKALDIHALEYLCKVDRDELVAPYIAYLRTVGLELLRNGSFGRLRNPFSEEALRRQAESSRQFIVRKHAMTAEEQESELRSTVEAIRIETMEEAVKWQMWKSQVDSRIETQFEAQYRRWEAHAIECAKFRKGGDGLRDRLQRLRQSLYGEPDPEYRIRNNPWRNVKIIPAAILQEDGRIVPIDQGQPVAQGQPEAQGNTEATRKAQEWEDIEISFLSDERVQITTGNQTETRNYGELGFMDKRGGKPNEAWKLLRTLARARGHIPSSARRADPDDILALGKRFERLRKTLMNHFGISSDPVPLDAAHGYNCRFKIGCAPSFDK